MFFFWLPFAGTRNARWPVGTRTRWGTWWQWNCWGRCRALICRSARGWCLNSFGTTSCSCWAWPPRSRGRSSRTLHWFFSRFWPWTRSASSCSWSQCPASCLPARKTTTTSSAATTCSPSPASSDFPPPDSEYCSPSRSAAKKDPPPLLQPLSPIFWCSTGEPRGPSSFDSVCEKKRGR